MSRFIRKHYSTVMNFLLLLLFFVTGCGSERAKPCLSSLESPDPAQRIRAIKWAGDNEVESAVPLLVDRLIEHDVHVRFFAIRALEQITGETYGFDYKADAESRARAVLRWRESLEQ